MVSPYPGSRRPAEPLRRLERRPGSAPLFHKYSTRPRKREAARRDAVRRRNRAEVRLRASAGRTYPPAAGTAESRPRLPPCLRPGKNDGGPRLRQPHRPKPQSDAGAGGALPAGHKVYLKPPSPIPGPPGSAHPPGAARAVPSGGTRSGNARRRICVLAHTASQAAGRRCRSRQASPPESSGAASGAQSSQQTNASDAPRSASPQTVSTVSPRAVPPQFWKRAAAFSRCGEKAPSHQQPTAGEGLFISIRC